MALDIFFRSDIVNAARALLLARSDWREPLEALVQTFGGTLEPPRMVPVVHVVKAVDAGRHLLDSGTRGG